MTTWIALLRGINVGGRNKLPMKPWAASLSALGLAEVQTYIQSGNAVFRAADREASELGEAIASAIEAEHGFRPPTMVLSATALDRAMARNPFPEAVTEPKTLHYFFCAQPPDAPDLDALAAVAKDNERFHLDGTVFYLHAPDGLGRSKLGAQVERRLGVPVTARNHRTVEKLDAMARQLASYHGN